MTDCEFLAYVLADGKPHCLNEILKRSFLERGCGLTVHSRAAELRTRGYDIHNWKDGTRGEGSWYMLVGASGDGHAAGGADGNRSSCAPPVCPSPDAQPDGQLVLAAPEFRKRHAA